MSKTSKIIPLPIEVKKYANNKVLSVDIPENISNKFKGISRGSVATAMVKEEKDCICVIYKFDK
jgi:hypothetical protein